MSGGGFHRPRMIFVSIVARSCRKPFQRWNLDRKGTLSGGIPSSTNDLRFHRGPIMYVGGHSSGGTSTGRVPCREGFIRPRMIFVSTVARSCRRPFQRWNFDQQGTLSGGVPSSTNDLRSHRSPAISEAIPAVEPRPVGHLDGIESFRVLGLRV